MSSSEDMDEELPDLDINGSGGNGPSWCMPSAAELAAQRALEAARERKIALLREVGGAGGVACARVALHHSSSSSEGEALSSTLESLRVKGADGRGAAAPGLAECLRALRGQLAPGAGADDWLQALLDLADGPQAALNEALDEFLSVVEHHSGEWRGAAALCAGAVLGACCVCGAGAGEGAGERAGGGQRVRRRRVPRAAALLQRLLDETDDEELRTGLLRWALSCLPPPALLALGDAARAGGGGGGGEELARSLARAAVAALLRPEDPPLQVLCMDEAVRIPSLTELSLSVRGAWVALPPPRQELLLAGAARALAGGSGGAGGEGARLLAALRAAAAAAPRRHDPDSMKVLVTASKLQLLLAPEPPAAPAAPTAAGS